MNPDLYDQRANLDQYAAALRDLRTLAAEHPETTVDRIRLEAEDALAAGKSAVAPTAFAHVAEIASLPGFAALADEFEATFRAHLPHIPAGHIGAVLLDLSRLMISSYGTTDPNDQIVLEQLPFLLAFVGQQMYSGGTS